MVESMLNNNAQSQDAVLGGDRPAPIDSLVLGGLSGLQQQFDTKDIAVQIAALVNAVDFGDEAIALLIQGLNSEMLQLRGIAYNLLKQIGSPAAIAAAGEGVPLKVGDRIYAAYRSSISYGDDWYSINASIDEEWQHEEYPLYRPATDTQGTSFFYITDDREENKHDVYDEGYYPELLALYLMQVDAESKVEKKYKQAFLDMSVNFNEIERDWDDFDQDNEDDDQDENSHYARNFDIAAWCDRHGVAFAFDEREDVWEVQDQLLNFLYEEEEVDLLYDIWPQVGYEPLAFVHEYVIDRPCYLRMTAA
jgi:hypothetical protein